MKEIISEHVTLRDFLIGAVILILLAVFCFVAGISYIIPLILLFTAMHMLFIRRASRKMYLQFGLLLALPMAMTATAMNYLQISPYFAPVAVSAMLTMLLFNDFHLVFIMSLVGSLLAVLAVDGSLEMALIFSVGSLTAAYSVKDARSRGTMINAGLYVAVMQIFAAMLFNICGNRVVCPGFWAEYLRPLLVNGFLASFITLALLKVFEILFGVLTNFSLLELSDFNQPLLKKMILEAPGTYHHSLVVGNMAESAADSINANALLTRVGAYYHDIGKLEKPEYFTENQLVGGNKHDTIEPSMSKLVIINHVKRGMDMAKKYKLNPVIADFIPQHHGTSMTYFFYQKALEEADDPSTVKEDDFRYPGPKPQRKETAIVLLADSVEAATRSLDEPNPQKIEEVVRKIINNKFIDGQLDDCQLTLKEIDRIATTFTRVLSAMYHSRVKYPEKNPDEDD